MREAAGGGGEAGGRGGGGEGGDGKGEGVNEDAPIALTKNSL